MKTDVGRIYDDVDPGDGAARVLVDRLWPRGISKEDVAISEAAVLAELIGVANVSVRGPGGGAQT
ncbi:hypothetical protein ACQPZJ_16475 [Actinoplanes sp. CA-054009]